MRKIKVVAVSLLAALAFSVHAAPQADNLARSNCAPFTRKPRWTPTG